MLILSTWGFLFDPCLRLGMEGSSVSFMTFTSRIIKRQLLAAVFLLNCEM